jgi:phospholipid/cholesterol/gamma-HCH transport system substrate-binding protein
VRRFFDRSFRDFNPYVVGLVSVGVIAVAVGLALAVGILHLFEDTYRVRAVFPDAAGTKNGDEVRVAGLAVGRITDIEPDRLNGNVIIEFVVDQGIEMPPDTRAEIALTTLLGTKFIRLTGDVPETGPFLHDLPADERVIPIERTKVPFEILDLISTASRTIQDTDNKKLNSLIGSLADVTEGNAEEIASLIGGLDEVAGALNERDNEIRSLLDRADTLTDLLAEKDETLLELVERSRGVLRLVSDRRSDIADGIGDTEVAVRELARIVGTHKSFLDALLDTLHPTLLLVEDHQTEVDATLARLGPGVMNLSRAGGRGPFTDIYIRSVGPDLPAIFGDLLDGS